MKENRVPLLGAGAVVSILMIVAMTLLTVTSTTSAKNPNAPNPALIEDLSNRLEALEKVLYGTIIMWNGSLDENGEHPVINGVVDENWCVCDGSNGTPDLRNRFIIGAFDSIEFGTSGGSDQVVLGEENMPEHRHGAGDLAADSAGSAHIHELNNTILLLQYEYGNTWVAEPIITDLADNTPAVFTKSDGAHGHTINGHTDYAGEADPTAIDILPPYYSLIFLMYVGPS